MAGQHIVHTLKVFIAAGATLIFCAAGGSAELTLHIKDYVTAPMTGQLLTRAIRVTTQVLPL